MILLLLLLGAFFGTAQEIALAPADRAALDSWAQVNLPLRLYPTPSRSVAYEGPSLLTRLYGEISLGAAGYVFLLGVDEKGQVRLWVDFDGDSRLGGEEEVLGTPVQGGIAWALELQSWPPGAEPFPYPLLLLWPEGRGYVFLVGGAPHTGSWQGHEIVVVDGDLDGVFGTKGDFFGIDLDGDGVIYAELDGHEHFGLWEPFTLGAESFKVAGIRADGKWIRVEKTDYVPPKVPLIPGAPAPNFSFRDFLTGQTIALSELRGKVVLLDFWATWCPPCMASLPKLVEVYREFHPRGFEIVGVSLDESKSDLRQVLTSYAITWSVAFEGKRWDNAIASLYRVYQIPTTYLLDKNGVIRFRNVEGEALREAIRELLAEPGASSSSSVSGLSPEPILEIQAPTKAELRKGAENFLALRLVNTSAYPAEEVRLAPADLPTGVEVRLPEPFSIPPRGEQTVQLSLVVGNADPQAFPAPVKWNANYRYCPDETCFQVAQESLTLVILEEDAQAGFAPPLWILILLAVGLLALVVLLGQS